MIDMEANTMRKLGSHPCLVNMVEADKHFCCYKKPNTSSDIGQCEEPQYTLVKEEINYIVLEKCQNGALSRFYKNTGSFEEDIARFLFIQVCHAVHFLHSQEYVHLDIKLDNILLDEFFNIKLADLGIALCAKGTSALLAHKRGTSKYMAPEVENSSSDSPYNCYKADIYSLGIVLHLLVFGQHPTAELIEDNSTGIHESTDSEKVFTKDKMNSFQNSFVSAECQDLIQRMINPDPAKRPSIEEIGMHSWMLVEIPESMPSTVYLEMSERLNFMKRLVEKPSVELSLDME